VRAILFIITIFNRLRKVIAKYRRNESIAGSDICAGTARRFVTARITRVAKVDTTGKQVVLKIVLRSCTIT